MRTGYIISGVGHLALILWLIFGGIFSHVDEAEFVAADVSILSEAEFAALTDPNLRPAPELSQEVVTPAVPEDVATPETPEPDPVPENTEAPAVPDTTEQADPPDVSELAALPEPEVVETTPEIEPLPDDAIAPPLILPEDSAPQQADRVAPEPVPLPEPDVDVADTLQPALSPDATQPSEQEAQDQTAPEAATSEIVTEAEEEDTGLSVSPRPPSRPTRPQPPEPQVAETPDPEPQEPESDPLADVIGEAVAEANEQAEEPRVASGPPLTRGEREGLRLAVQQCWNVDVGSEAANVTVVIGMSMGRDGKVIGGSLRLIDSDGGTGRAAETAFQAARRAVLRCQRDGYKLPIDKYEHWQEIEITFNPENMRTR